MRFVLSAALTFALGGCAMLAERAPDYAANAMDQTAYRATGAALDTAESGVRNAGSGSSDEGSQPEKITRKVDDDDVLVNQDGTYMVGKRLGSHILLVSTGQKIPAEGAEVIAVRRAKKGDLKIGSDVYFTTSRGDVRRAHWMSGAVTDDARVGKGFVAAGSETDLEWDGQVVVKK
ncbi:MAG: hypothetical protein ACK4N5_10175 [Myxococcales bacterium]